MERNKNVDIIRAIAILLIVTYHIFALSQVSLVRGTLYPFLEYSGEYGVTLFFILSGFAIYKSLFKRKDDFKYFTFLKDRLIRILPLYYFSLILFLFFTNENIGMLFSKGNLFNLISHFLLIHGFFLYIEGSISGVAWALTPIFCFYLIAPLLFKAIEKKPKLTLIISIIFSCVIKFICYNWLVNSGKPAVYEYFSMYRRSIFGLIDEFVIGMFLAKYISLPKDNKKIILNIILVILSIVGLYFWIYVDRFQVNIITENTGRVSNCFVGYIWYTVLSLILAVGIYGFSRNKNQS